MDRLKSNRSGFTLVELLMVIAIISLLSSVIFSAVNEARAKARDATRISDLAQIRRALELYYDEWGKYPIPTNSTSFGTPPIRLNGSSQIISFKWTDTGSIGDLLSPYIDIPSDPIQKLNNIWPWNSEGYAYTYFVDAIGGTQYDLIGRLEKINQFTCKNIAPINIKFPSDIYNSPTNDWCASFLATPQSLYTVFSDRP
jgi:prepilin-type N-terminal cleavage/methylation domain-containing protein